MRKNFVFIVVSITLLVLILIIFTYINGINRLERPIDTGNLNIGNYELFAIGGKCTPASICTDIIAKKSLFQRVKIASVNDLSKIVQSVSSTEEVLDYISLLNRLKYYIKGLNCVKLEEHIIAKAKEDLNDSTFNFTEIEVIKEGDDYKIERVVGCYGNPDRIVRTRETISSEGEYIFSEQR